MKEEKKNIFSVNLDYSYKTIYYYYLLLLDIFFPLVYHLLEHVKVIVIHLNKYSNKIITIIIIK